MLLSLGLASSAPGFAADQSSRDGDGPTALTEGERAWLAEHPVIRLTPDPLFPPLEYFDEKGNFRGIGADFVALLEKKLGIRFEVIRVKDWKESLARTIKRENDVWSVVAQTPERSEFMLFTKPYIESPAVIVVRSDTRRRLALDDLKGMKVTIASGYAVHEFLKSSHPDMAFDTVPDPLTGLKKVSFGMADAMVINIALASHLMEKAGISNLMIAGEAGYTYKWGFASRSDWPELHSILANGLAQITPDERKAITRKWIALKDQPGIPTKTLVIWGLAILAVLIMGGVLAWNRLLKSQINLRTRELEFELVEHARAEDALVKSEKRFRDLTEGSVQGILIRRGEKVLFANQAFADIFGYGDPEGILGLDTYLDLFPPGDRARIRQIGDARMRDEVVPSFYELQGLRKDGSIIWLENRARTITWEGAAAVQATMVDVTERKRFEEALKESRALLLDAVQSIGDGFALYDRDERLVLFNDQYREFWSRLAEKLVPGTSFQEICESTWDYGYANVEGVTKEQWIEYRLRRFREAKGAFERRLGDDRWVLISERRMRDGGTVSLSVDITERKQVENALRRQALILDQMSDGVIVTGLDGTIIDWNKGAERMFGYSEEEMLGRSPALLDSPIRRHDQRTSIDGSLVHDWHWTGEHYFVRKDGSEGVSEVVILPFRGEDGEIVAHVGVNRDVTERKKIEQMKNEFISTVSHELRTPLTSIKGALGLIQGGVAGKLPKKIRSMIDIAHTNTDRLVRLINDILDIEKIEAGKMDFKFKPVEIGPLLEQVIEANRAYGEGFKVKFLLRPGVPEATVNGDSDRLTQVFTNLLSNAAKFSPADDEVTVSAARRNGTLRVSVSDRGPGVPEEYHDQLFEKFSQADASDARQKGGTGLGLSISKAIVEKHGGTIGFTTAAGKGSTFFVDLPVLGAVPKAKPSPAGTRVLVCEDDRDVAMLLSMMLEQGGYSSDIALTAAEAKHLLAENAYAAMTIDLALPDQLGISLIRELRSDKKTRNLPIIVVSAHVDTGNEELNGDAFGIIDWISKPIDPKRVLQGVRMAVRRRSNGKPRLLHVEDDPDVRTVVANIVGDAGEVTPARTLKEAQQRLRDADFDLVILDLILPDGSGESLIPSLRKPDGRTTPVIVFSVKEVSREAAEDVAASLVKARTSNDDLLSTIRSFLEDASAA